MISNTDHHNKKQKQRRTALVATLLGSALCTMTSIAHASETEEFAIKQDPNIQNDGGTDTLTGIANGIPYTVVQGFAVAQGDMVLGKLTADGKLDLPLQPRGIGQSGNFERWPDGIVPYQFAADVAQIQRDRAQSAIEHWNSRTSIKLVSRTSDNEADYNNYINFQSSFGCASYVGRKGGEQEIWLADSCTVGSIIHELGHAIGLFHEHTRPDRDNFVTVNWDNVPTDKKLNFEKVEIGAANYSDYDYGSIMHYGEYFFSSNGQRSISVPDGIFVGQRDALSDKDIASVNQMYATDLKLAVSSEPNEADHRIDLVVSNIGTLGANTLRLTAQLGADSDWISVSANSGWDCQQFGAELRCTRETLAERNDSSFSILVDPNSAPIADLKVRVESRTIDTDASNNVFNDTLDSAPEEPTEENQPEQEPLATNDSDVTNNNADTPITVDNSANTGGGNTSGSTTDNTQTAGTAVPQVGAANSGESSGGGAGLYLLLLAFGARALRRKQATVQ